MNLRPADLRWQTGKLRWSKIRTLVITDDARQRQRLAVRRDTRVVTTPLELVMALEESARDIAMVVVAGRFVDDPDLAAFLGDSYPELGVDRIAAEAN